MYLKEFVIHCFLPHTLSFFLLFHSLSPLLPPFLSLSISVFYSLSLILSLLSPICLSLSPSLLCPLSLVSHLLISLSLPPSPSLSPPSLSCLPLAYLTPPLPLVSHLLISPSLPLPLSLVSHLLISLSLPPSPSLSPQVVAAGETDTEKLIDMILQTKQQVKDQGLTEIVQMFILTAEYSCRLLASGDSGPPCATITE